VDPILVTYAPRTDVVGELALVIGEQLSRAGHRVELRPCANARTAEGFPIVVVGSSVTRSGWHPDALRFLSANSSTLQATTTWLFEYVGPDLDRPPLAGRHGPARIVGAPSPTQFIATGGTSSPWQRSLPDHPGMWDDARSWAVDQLRTWETAAATMTGRTPAGVP
jgi:hypothetical protein